MKRLRFLLFSLIGGVAIALLTGLLNNTPGGMLIGATWYGYPFAWLIQRIVAPQHFPWIVHPVELVLDVLVWTLIVAAVQLVYMRKLKK